MPTVSAPASMTREHWVLATCFRWSWCIESATACVVSVSGNQLDCLCLQPDGRATLYVRACVRNGREAPGALCPGRGRNRLREGKDRAPGRGCRGRLLPTEAHTD